VGTVLAVALAVLVVACGPAATPAPPGSVLDDPAALAGAGVARLGVTVLGTTPHDRTAFTQGFEIDGGTLWEGTGREGRSELRELDPATGALRRSVPLPADVFGEGVTVLPDRVWQLTWRDGVVYDRDPATLAVRRTLPLDREGWGICHLDGRLVTSDGSDELVFRDPVSFVPTGAVRVTAAGAPVRELNELECTPGGVWANVWQTDHVVRVDPASGRVTAVVDAAGLLPPADRAGADVLNGIAAVPGTDEFLLTGKLWPTTFRVRFVPR
jgi:glutaminyl-peptide cyclotransferase